jgi:ATP-dependent RNA helicase CshB
MEKIMSNEKTLESYLNILGFKKPTEVQARVFSSAIEKKNLVVQSVTGTGKTYAFLIPIFACLKNDIKDLQVVITSPTRELARQIYEMAKPLAEHDNVDVRLYVGGDNLEKAKARLEVSNPQIAIGTPGRIRQLSLEYGLLNVFRATTFIIDEADMTMDSGFLPLIDEIVSQGKEGASFQVYSATIPQAIEPFLKKYLSNPVFIEVNKKDLTPLNISHYFLKTKYKDKIELIKELMNVINPYLAIIYCNTQDTVKMLYKALKDDKRVCAIYGDMEPSKRKSTMRDIRELKYTFVISTDLTSRGLDIKGISHIINFELPSDIEFYIHRTGRTGRMLDQGTAISFYDYDDDSYIDKLEAKGLHTEYKDLKNGEIVDSKSRYERERKDFYKSKLNQQAEKKLRNKRTISKKVKPNYKKNFNKAVREERKKIVEKRYKTKHE